MNKSLKAIIVAFPFLIVKTVYAQKISDDTLKKNYAPVRNALASVSQLTPITYEFEPAKYKNINMPSGLQLGFNTSEVMAVAPTAIRQESKWYSRGKNDQQSIAINTVDLEKLVPLLVGAIKEQQVELEDLKATIRRLEQKTLNN